MNTPIDDTRVWWHIILTCRGQWLPGDPRGFRSRAHRVHSSGDYKHRPPEGEHAKLHEYHRAQSAKAVSIPRDALMHLGESLLCKANAIESPCLAIAAGMLHTHLLLALRNDWAAVKREVGRLKQAASHALRDLLPGRIWADDGKPIRIRDHSHQREVFRYILDHAKQGAWVWRYDEEGGDPDLRCAQVRLLDNFLRSRQPPSRT